ncbi:MAG: hypothetical protein RIQ50_370 [Bacteroidota bacterium]
MRLLISFTVLLSTIVLAVCCMEPEQIKQPEVVYLNQGWSDEDRSTFYWAPQGSALISYDIYMSLVDPETQLPINAPELTSQFGFLQEKRGNAKNPDEFPIGVSRSIVKEGPFKGDYIGLTCAACHTNQINYNNLSIRIDGGNSTSIQLVPWMKTLKRAVEHVKSDTAAFHVLLQDIRKKTTVEADDLRSRIHAEAKVLEDWIEYGFKSDLPDGPGRIDAFAGISNVFVAMHSGIKENYSYADAPVKPPFLWNTSHSAWVEWSGVSNLPIQRNFSEALGVFARFDLSPNAKPEEYPISTVDVGWTVKIEKMIRRLAPPQWPEKIFGKIDRAKAERGAVLFTQNCSKCHSTYPHRWSDAREKGMRMIENALVPQHIVGTDPSNLKSFALDTNRIVKTKHLKSLFNQKDSVTPQEYFKVIEGAMMQWALTKQKFTAEEILDASGFLSNEELKKQSPPVYSYKAAPRDGSWSIGPFLHNGSVPTIYQLLSPAHERSTEFYLNSDFDPVNLGIKNPESPNGFLVDTKMQGNSNAGHSFENTKGPGVIGRLFTKEERYELIEYLKSIPQLEGQITPYGGPPNPKLAKQDTTWFNYRNPY